MMMQLREPDGVAKRGADGRRGIGTALDGGRRQVDVAPQDAAFSSLHARTAMPTEILWLVAATVVTVMLPFSLLHGRRSEPRRRGARLGAAVEFGFYAAFITVAFCTIVALLAQAGDWILGGVMLGGLIVGGTLDKRPGRDGFRP
jgi:hypothetical protein